MTMKYFDAYLFDYNGVLIDDERLHLRALQLLLAPLEIELTERDYFGRYLGMNDPTIIRRILSDHGHCPSERWVARLVELKFRTFVDLAEDRLPVVQAACSLIRTLVDSGSVVGVVSGASRQEIELGLSELDVKQLVSFIVSAEDAPRSKPDPQGYLQALSRVSERAGGGGPLRCLVFEDAIPGIEAAHRAGMGCVAVASSRSVSELRSTSALAVIRSLDEVTDSLLQDLSEQAPVLTWQDLVSAPGEELDLELPAALGA